MNQRLPCLRFIQLQDFAPRRFVLSIGRAAYGAYLSPPKGLVVSPVRPKYPGADAQHADVLSSTRNWQNTAPRRWIFADTTGDRFAAYFHTGGPTGMPKVVQRYFPGMMYNARLVTEAIFSGADYVICPQPLFHVIGCHFVLISAIGSAAWCTKPLFWGNGGLSRNSC